MKFDLAALFAGPPRLDAMGPAQRRLVLALRQVVLHSTARRCPMRHLALALGGTGQARDFLSIVRTMGDIWPEAIRVHRPCSAMLAPDEMLFIDLLDKVVRRDEIGFHRLVEDLLSEMARGRLLADMLAFATAYIGPAPRHMV